MRSILLLWILWLGCGALSAQEAPALGERVRIEDEVLARWNTISRLEVGEKSKAWIAEGREVLARYQELLALESKADADERGELNIEISKLKLKLIHLLRSIEEARLFDMSPAQLEALRQQYETERGQLLARRSLVRDSVLEEGERFLTTYRRDRNLQKFSQRDVVAKLCLQLAELYYSRAEEEYFGAQDSLLARAERGLPAGLEPVKNFEDAVRKYQRVIDEFPFSDFMDDALYNVAYIRENSPNPVEVEESRRLYEHLVRDFPASVYAPEAWMRLGEYWFRQDGEESLRSAIAAYQKILDYPDYPSREKALYKLGWCHYRLQEHETSVQFFAEAAKYAARKQESGDALGADLLDESIAYMAVNYADPNWADANIGQLAQRVRQDEELRRTVGFRLLDRYGDLFRQETQDFPRAVTAYDSLLVLYPDSPQAPFIQEKVIECYAPGALADAQIAYQEKNQLFELYGGAGPWQGAGADSSKVTALLEQHLEENVRIAMNHAYAGKRREAFDEYILQSRRYLGSFPQDSAAFQIHWNLAKTLEAELQDYGTAYDEYLSISRGYPERDRHDAAYNAIVISQILVDQEGAPAAAPDSALTATPLTPMEEKKRAALQNFVSLFAEDTRSPGYSLLEGKLFYAHHDFDQATAVFDTLITRWPQAPEVAEAYQLKLEGLFALGRFPEAEAIAREIQGMDLPAEALQRARTRQAESVYSNAANLKKGEDHLKAAQEFRRMALDVPDAPFADASLLDAAAEFTLAGQPGEASDTYLYLADHYPQSQYADQALSQAGFLALNESKDLAKAGAIFERLANQYPESQYARSSITNASYCYGKVEDWSSTIRMNALYVERYPDADDASAVLFENAGLWLKLNNVPAANAIYADFAARYPDDSRTVQAFVERAEYFTRQQDEAAARVEYRQAVERNRQLLNRGTEGNAIYASRALRKLVGWRFEEYRALNLLQPAGQFERDLAAKKAARDGLLAELNELAQLGTGDVFYARHLIAATHEEFARAYREQERPAWRSPEERVKGEVTLQDAAHELARVAARSYIGTTQELDLAVESLRKEKLLVARRLEGLDAWLAAGPDSGATREGLDDSLAAKLALTRAADLLDSSLTESTVWTGRSRERVPELMLASLAVFEQRVDQTLVLKSQQTGDVFLRLADTDRNLLGGASMVALQSVIGAYREALEIIGQVGLDRLWRSRLEERLRVQVLKLPQAAQAFRAECGGEFDTQVRRFLETVDKGENFVDRAGLTEEDYGSDVLDMADFNQGYAINSLLLTDRILQSLDENELAGNLAGELSDTLASHALRFSQETNTRRAGMLGMKEDYWKRFEQSASYVHRDAHTTLDDASYFLLQTAKEVLVQSEPLVSRIRAGSVPARRMLLALAELDPATFGNRFGLSEETLALPGLAAWKSHRGYVEGFEKPDYPDMDWDAARSTSLPGLGGLGAGATTVWTATPLSAPQRLDTLALALGDSTGLAGALAAGATPLDTLAAADGTWLRLLQAAAGSSATGTPDTLFFRYTFDLPGTPVGATIQVAADDAFFLFFNGEYIDEQAGGAEEQPGLTELKTYTLNEFLRTGRNVLAVEARDRDGSGGGLAVDLQVRQIARLTPEMLEQQIQRELEEQRKLDFQRKVSRIHVKNRMD
ncbi:MAG: tetratricopeptide repeat protein [Candidatus Delongbacteria bacterium]